MDEDLVRDARKDKGKLEDEDQISLPPNSIQETLSNLGDDTISLKIVGPTRDHEAVETNSELSESKNMDEDFVRDARKGKAKLEDTGLMSLPPIPTPQIQSNLGFDTIYLKIVGPLREVEAVETESPESVKKIQFRFRNKDIHRILGKDDATITNIHTVSGATIGILSNTPAKIHRQLYLQLLGTADQVKIAEILITDAITEAYEKPYIPKPLMPTNICHHAITVLLTKVIALLGINDVNLLKMESESDTWIEVDSYPPEGKTMERVVNIYGQGLDVSTAICMVHDRLDEYDRSVNAMNEVAVEEIGCSNKMGGEIDEDDFGSEEGDCEFLYDAEDDEM